MKNTEALKQEAENVLANAELFYSQQQVEKALDGMALQISEKLGDKNPLILCPMIGGLVITGLLLPRLGFPLQVDYIHATRYRGETSGKELHWIKKPGENVKNRTVLVLDDILDEGITLKTIVDECLAVGAASIHTGVLVDKEISKPKAIKQADFTGLKVPDSYIFGYGMDYKGFHRNCNAIYGVREP